MLELITVSVADIVPYKNNPKEHPKEQIEQIAESIREFGMDDPIAVDENNVIIEGQGRLLALKGMGIETAPCIRLSHLSEEQKRAYAIAHNKLTMSSGFDLEKLKAEFDFLNDAEFSLLKTGFDAAELDDLFNISAPKEGKEDNFDVTAELEQPCFTQKGDVWTLGRHRLICGDCTDKADFERLLGGSRVNLVVTDPPYNVDYEGSAGKISNDKMSDADFYGFLLKFFTNTAAVMAEKASIYVFHPQSEGLNFRKAYKDAGFYLSDTLVWKKNSIVMGRSPYQRMYEGILYGWKEKGRHEWFSDRKQSNVLEFDRPVRSGEHPTMKPIPLIAYLIGNSSKEGYSVLDPFGGSGTTLIASEQVGRSCFTSEIEPKYCDVIVKRYISQVGSSEGVTVERDGSALACSGVIKTGGEAIGENEPD
jgi:DNA modification methylase